MPGDGDSHDKFRTINPQFPRALPPKMVRNDSRNCLVKKFRIHLCGGGKQQNNFY